MSGYMGGGATERRALDFYPTPASATVALREWLLEAKLVSGWSVPPMLDPAAGDGAIIRAMREGFRLGEAFWHAIEIDGAHEDALEGVAEDVRIGDALALDEWPDALVVANPPFGRLDEFWVRTAAHRRKAARVCAVFMPVAWWSAEKRRGYVRPDHVLQLGWRPTFVGQSGPAHKGSQDFVWAVLAPSLQASATWTRLEKPKPSKR
jgi:hypothetical protein